MEYVFTFERTNEAMKAEFILNEAGLPVKVMNLPSTIKAGCGICLRLAEGYQDTARKLLQQKGLRDFGCYIRQMENGRSRYTPCHGG